MRVALVPTGRMELLALPDSLKRLFPEHVFESVGVELEPLPGHKTPLASFTSRKVELSKALEWDSLRELVQTATSLVLPSRPGGAFDLVMLLEDLELVNRDQPEVVIQALRTAALSHIASLPPSIAEEARWLLRDRVSFHLAVPMIEAWFFAALEALEEASVPKDRLPPRLASGRDPEDFLTDDADYRADQGGDCTTWKALAPKKQKSHAPPWLNGTRELHPKAYLSWLCRHPSRQDCTSYIETKGGARALRKLDWAKPLSTPEHYRYLRAFVTDLADALRTWPAGVSQAGKQALLTSLRTPRSHPVLRNI